MPDDLHFPDLRCLLHIGSYVYLLYYPPDWIVRNFN